MLQAARLGAREVEQNLTDADMVVVHESVSPDCVARASARRVDEGRYVLLFHDTSGRSLTDPASLARLDLRGVDGVLASVGNVARLYLERGWAQHSWAWYEAADTRIFGPRRPVVIREHFGPDRRKRVRADHRYDDDVVWMMSDGRAVELADVHEFLITPVKRLDLRAVVYASVASSLVGSLDGTADAVGSALRSAGIPFRARPAEEQMPDVYARFAVALSMAPPPFLDRIFDAPPLSLFEALACGCPVVSARWPHVPGLLTPGRDVLVARTSDEMCGHLDALLARPTLHANLALHGLRSVQDRHTCAHRAEELLAIAASLRHRTDEHARPMQLTHDAASA